jgi:hypothetical protein
MGGPGLDFETWVSPGKMFHPGTSRSQNRDLGHPFKVRRLQLRTHRDFLVQLWLRGCFREDRLFNSAVIFCLTPVHSWQKQSSVDPVLVANGDINE